MIIGAKLISFLANTIKKSYVATALSTVKNAPYISAFGVELRCV